MENFNLQQPLNLGEGTIWYGGIGFCHYESSRLQDVVNSVRSWCEQNVCYGHQYPYRRLASDFGIPSSIVEEIEMETQACFA